MIPAPGVTPIQVLLLISHERCFLAAQKELESRGNKQYLHAELGIVEGSLQDPQYPTEAESCPQDDLEDEDYD